MRYFHIFLSPSHKDITKEPIIELKHLIRGYIIQTLFKCMHMKKLTKIKLMYDSSSTDPSRDIDTLLLILQQRVEKIELIYHK